MTPGEVSRATTEISEFTSLLGLDMQDAATMLRIMSGEATGL